MTRRRRAVCAILALLATGCPSSKPRVDSTTPVLGGTLRVAVRDLSSLDPAKATGRGATFVLSQIFRSLTTVDDQGNPQPGAAASWTVAPNGLRWEFVIATGTFHDGSPVTAADFKFAFDRISLKATRSDVAFQLEAVKGFHAAKVAGTAKGLSGVVVTSPTKLSILLDRPFAELPVFLAHPALAPIRAAAFNPRPETFGAQPVGNGPFRVAEPRTPTGVTLARYDGYAGTKAYVDEVRVTVETDSEKTWTELRGGRLDVGEVPASRLADAKRLTGNENGFTPFWAATYYGLNLRLPKYANVNVRRALSLAIDREALARDVYGGTKDVATGLVPNGIPQFAAANQCDVCRRDTARARTLLQAAFAGKAPEFTIDHLDASPSREVAQAVARTLQDMGLRIALRAHSSAQYLTLLQSGKHDIAELGWLSDVPSPDAFLAQQLRTGSPNNQTAFKSAKFDQIIDAARASRDAAARAARYREAEAQAISALPLIPLVFFRNHIGVRPNVRAFRLDGAGIFDASAVWLAPQ